MTAVRIAAAALLLSFTAAAADRYLFTSFRKNGETGVYFALSEDGRAWQPLNANQPWVKPGIPGMLMRDPFLARGADGVWHMIWTTGWTRDEKTGALTIGHASSKDLVTWSEQRLIPVMGSEPTARNAWAPEAVWDETRREWRIFWASTIPGRFPAEGESGGRGYNHRLYAMTTRDWVSFSEAKLWFDPGFNAIDSTLVRDGKRWVMVFKDERESPVQKRLRLAFADSAAG
ncbi:MAG TPA: glycosyl hydrolase, partial [Solibacterales bacterium]|nr:glycosyl hydrolase [Bryobacterales bacterium]